MLWVLARVINPQLMFQDFPKLSSLFHQREQKPLLSLEESGRKFTEQNNVKVNTPSNLLHSILHI